MQRAKTKTDLTTSIANVISEVSATPREEKSTLREKESDNINSTLKSQNHRRFS